MDTTIPSTHQAMAAAPRDIAHRASSIGKVARSYAMRLMLGAALLSGGIALSASKAQAATPPDLVKQAGALNLGGTSFYDGFGRLDEGFTFLQYLHYSNLYDITDIHGHTLPSAAINEPHIQSEATLEQLSFTTPWHPYGGAVAFSAAIPISNLDESSQPPPGSRLTGNGFGIGDSTFGPIYQSAPIFYQGRPVFSWRTQLQIIAPIGNFTGSRNLNNSSGFWVINPYVTFTVLPTPKWEISVRTHYIYNFETNDLSGDPSTLYHNGQAGQGMFLNYASSYKVSDKAYLGINGFYLRAFSDDKVNGIQVPNTRQQFLYFGPGGRYQFDKMNVVNLNINFPLLAQNVPSGGIQINLQWIHKFDGLGG